MNANEKLCFGYPQATILDFVCTGNEAVSHSSKKMDFASGQKHVEIYSTSTRGGNTKKETRTTYRLGGSTQYSEHYTADHRLLV